tara:strand:- start:1681 stop:2226 length:546 start_codon:yes stop_codon:yes gene_type:complete
LAPPFARTRSPTLRSHANPRPLSRPLASPRPLVPLVLGLVLGSLVVAFVSVSDRAFSTTDRAIAYRASPASSFGAPRVVVVARRVGAVAIERGRGALDRRAMPSMRVARERARARAFGARAPASSRRRARRAESRRAVPLTRGRVCGQTKSSKHGGIGRDCTVETRTTGRPFVRLNRSVEL